MSDHGGKRDGSGRKKGSQNRFSSAIKDAVLEAFEQLGGVKHMTKWARKNPTDFYRIAAKLIPQQINADVSHFNQEASDYTDEQLESMLREDPQKRDSRRTAKKAKGAEKLH